MSDKNIERGDVGATRRLAHGVVNLRLEDVDREVLEIAKCCLLDWIGSTLAGSAEDLVDRLVETVGATSEGVSLLGRREFVATTGDAALINGTAGHAIEYDDSGLQAHVTAPVAPAVLALAEELEKTGYEFLSAFLAGLECELRIDEMTNPWVDLRAWHGTGVIGVFGAAAGCARLLNLNVEQVEIALGLAGVQGSGLKWAWGSMAKSLQAGMAASRGVMAARLSANGFTTYPDIIEGKRGFGEMFVGENFNANGLVEGGKHPIHNVLFKFHASCHGTHSPIEAMAAVLESRPLQPEEIDSIVIEVPDGMSMSDWNIDRPTTALESKFSARACVAYTVLGWDTSSLDTYTEDRLKSPEYHSVAEKISIIGVFSKTPLDWTEARAIVTLTNGEIIQRDVDIRYLDPSQRLDRIVKKFRVLASPVVGQARSQSIIDFVLQLEEQPRISELLALLSK